MFDLLVTFVCLFVRTELLPVDFASKLDSLPLPTRVDIIIGVLLFKELVREAPPKKKPCIFGLCPNCDLTPPIAQIRALCGTIFLPKIRKFFKQQF